MSNNSHNVAVPSGGPAIGIDLGTSTSAIALLNRDGVPQLIPDINGDTIVPSVVQVLPDGQLIVGSIAKSGAITYHDRTALEVKRVMGTGEVLRLGKRVMFPEEVSAEILKHLKRAAEEHIGQEIRDIVLTVPARFENAAREATKKAAEMAGLQVLRLVNEPTAAALAYGLTHLKDQQKVLVFDFGGGTLDVTVLEMFEGVLDVKTSVGDDRLGGKDVDDAIVNLLRDKYKETHGKRLPPPSKDRKISQTLKEEAEQYKKLLTFTESVQVELPFLTNEGGLSFTLTRETVDGLLEELLMRAMSLANEALARARLRWEDIDVVLPVGGSSRLPLFRRALEFASGKPLFDAINPDEAVALGAAIAAGIEHDVYAQQQKGIMILDVSPHRLGVATIKQVGSEQFIEDYFSELVPKDAKLPAIQKRDYQTRSDGEGPILIRIYEAANDSNLCRDHRLVSELPLRSISVDARDEPVQVEFRYTLDGTLEVTARYLSAPMIQTDGRFSLDGSSNETPVPTEATASWRAQPLASMCTPLLEQVERMATERPEIVAPAREAAAKVIRALFQNDESEVRRHLDALTDVLFELA
jgi:molecular chaperone DnaK